MCACSPDYKHTPGGPYYFQTFVNDYKVTFTPEGEITAAEAAADESAGKAYCIAWFNERGRIAVFEKRLRRKTFLREVYRYKGDRLVEVRGVDADGKENVQNY